MRYSHGVALTASWELVVRGSGRANPGRALVYGAVLGASLQKCKPEDRRRAAKLIDARVTQLHRPWAVVLVGHETTLQPQCKARSKNKHDAYVWGGSTCKPHKEADALVDVQSGGNTAHLQAHNVLTTARDWDHRVRPVTHAACNSKQEDQIQARLAFNSLAGSPSLTFAHGSTRRLAPHIPPPAHAKGAPHHRNRTQVPGLRQTRTAERLVTTRRCTSMGACVTAGARTAHAPAVSLGDGMASCIDTVRGLLPLVTGAPAEGVPSSAENSTPNGASAAGAGAASCGTASTPAGDVGSSPDMSWASLGCRSETSNVYGIEMKPLSQTCSHRCVWPLLAIEGGVFQECVEPVWLGTSCVSQSRLRILL